ncbi:hypothetical protein PCA_05420 [Rhodanobacter sp. PCA2]|nr:hypothetical protein [Rhodanobacter sp. PCA2]
MSPSPKSPADKAFTHGDHACACDTHCAATMRHRGFSLIELMVGMLVSLICILAIMSAFAVYEGRKRTTTSGDDAQQSGSYSLYSLEQQIRTAGSGMVQGNRYGLWGCPMEAWSSSTKRLPLAGALPAPFDTWPLATRAVPVLVADGGTDAGGNVLPDVIGIIGGNPALRVFKAPVTGTPDASHVVLGNSFGINQGDYLLGIRSDGTCALALAATAPDASNNITLSVPGSPSTGLINTVNSYVFDMGTEPVISLYGVDATSHSLVSFDLLQRPVNGLAAAVLPVADGIVQIKALYGIHDGSGGAGEDPDVVDTWVQPTGAWSIGTLTATTAAAAAAMNQIKAVRVSIVAQSKLPEHASDYTNGGSLVLFPDQPTVKYTITTQPHYRYKVYDTTIPIHNALITKYF